MTLQEQQEMLISLALAVIDNREKRRLLAQRGEEHGGKGNPNYIINNAIYGELNNLVWDFRLEELDI